MSESSAVTSTSPASLPAGTDKFFEVTFDLEQACGSSIKRILQVNDMYGSPTMREAVLDEINKLRRFLKKRVERGLQEAEDGKFRGQPGVPAVGAATTNSAPFNGTVSIVPNAVGAAKVSSPA